MDGIDIEIFRNNFLKKVSKKELTADSVRRALLYASGVAITPLVTSEDVPMFCATSIVSAMEEKEEISNLIKRVAIGIEENVILRLK